jgi:hypothetical protein
MCLIETLHLILLGVDNRGVRPARVSSGHVTLRSFICINQQAETSEEARCDSRRLYCSSCALKRPRHQPALGTFGSRTHEAVPGGRSSDRRANGRRSPERVFFCRSSPTADATQIRSEDHKHRCLDHRTAACRLYAERVSTTHCAFNSMTPPPSIH